MFTKSCYIEKNTSQLRIELEKLGYKYKGKDNDHVGHSALYFYDGGYYEVYPSCPARYHSIVNCGTDEKLFLALAGMNK